MNLLSNSLSRAGGRGGKLVHGPIRGGGVRGGPGGPGGLPFLSPSFTGGFWLGVVQFVFGVWLVLGVGLVPWRPGFWQVLIPVFLALELAWWRVRSGEFRRS